MTVRDRTVLVVLAAIALLAGFWFAILAPKRSDARDLATQVEAAQQRLDVARQSAQSAADAKRDYDRAYATVARLGKAVPVDDNVPSLLYQLDAAARGGKINFQSIRLAGATGAPAPAPAPAATTPSTTGTPAADGSGTSTSTNPSSTTSTTTTTTPAPATQVAVAALPPGASVGPAGLPTMPFTFVFNGSFFSMERFLDEVHRFISVKKDELRVQGRLLTIDGISLSAAPSGFPRISANISATAFLLPAEEGLLNGATPQAPAGATGTGTTALVTGENR